MKTTKITTKEELNEKVDLSVLEMVHGEKCLKNLLERLPIEIKEVEIKRGQMSFEVDGVNYSIEKKSVIDFVGWKRVKRTIWVSSFRDRNLNVERKSDIQENVNSILLNEVLYTEEYKSLKK